MLGGICLQAPGGMDAPAIQQLGDRLIDCPGCLWYCVLKAVLLVGKLDEEVTQLYPELSGEERSFQTQIDMFHSLPGMTMIETLYKRSTLAVKS